MKFEHIETRQSDGNGGGTFLKVADGQSVTGVFRGELYKFWQSWPQGGTKQVFAEPTSGASLRFKINFVTQEEGKFVAKVWEFGATVNNMLFEIAQEVDLEKTKVKISRRGTGKNTSWIVIPLGEVQAKALVEIKSVTLNTLEPRESQPDGPVNNDPDGLNF